MSGRIWLGTFFVLFGFGFFLHQVEIINLSEILSNWWPFIFIIIGIIQLINRTHSSAISGFLFLGVGVIFLFNQWYDLNLIAYLWPFIFIVIGFVIILTRIKYEPKAHTSDHLNSFVLFSGAEIKSQSKEFRGGSVLAIFGGAEIDLRDTNIEEGATIDVTTVFGGASIIVPDHVRVEASGIPIFGGWEDSSRYRGAEEATVLKINRLTIFGGAEVKN